MKLNLVCFLMNVTVLNATSAKARDMLLQRVDEKDRKLRESDVSGEFSGPMKQYILNRHTGPENSPGDVSGPMKKYVLGRYLGMLSQLSDEPDYGFLYPHPI